MLNEQMDCINYSGLMYVQLWKAIYKILRDLVTYLLFRQLSHILVKVDKLFWSDEISFRFSRTMQRKTSHLVEATASSNRNI